MVLKWYCDLHIIVGTSLSIDEKILIFGFITYSIDIHIIDHFVFSNIQISLFFKKMCFLKQKICSKHDILEFFKNSSEDCYVDACISKDVS